MGCIYTAHFKYYCFSGEKPDYQPMEMFPQYDGYQQEQDTYTGPFGVPSSTNSFNFETAANPIRSWTLCPGDFFNRLIVSGIEIVKFDYTTETVGNCETLD